MAYQTLYCKHPNQCFFLVKATEFHENLAPKLLRFMDFSDLQSYSKVLKWEVGEKYSVRLVPAFGKKKEVAVLHLEQAYPCGSPGCAT
jgi:hypothetical protein